MTERERLTDLILNAPKLEFPFGSRAQGKTYQTAQNIADHLLANGVIVPPAPIGTKYYRVVEKQGKYKGTFFYIREAKLDYYNLGKALKDFGKTVFFYKEEAEKALAERSNNEES